MNTTIRNKIISIIIGIFAYIVIANIFHILLGSKNDIALGILYIYSDILYATGFTITFLFYGYNKMYKILHATLSIIFLLIYLYYWLIVTELPYERFLYIGLGLLIYLGETGYLKHCGHH